MNKCPFCFSELTIGTPENPIDVCSFCEFKYGQSNKHYLFCINNIEFAIDKSDPPEYRLYSSQNNWKMITTLPANFIINKDSIGLLVFL